MVSTQQCCRKEVVYCVAKYWNWVALCFKRQAVNTGKYSIILYGEKLQELSCLAHSSEKKVLNLMFHSLVILQEFYLQLLTVPSNLCMLHLHTYSHLGVAAAPLFTQNCSLCLLELLEKPNIGNPCVFVRVSPHPCGATPLGVGVLQEVTDGAECDQDRCCHSCLLFSCELAWICLCEMNSQWLVYI